MLLPVTVPPTPRACGRMALAARGSLATQVPVTGVKEKLSVTSLSTVCG